MVGRQRIDRARREYNKWVGDQTLEDYALRFTAQRARRFSSALVGQTAFGAVSFLALEAVGGSITLSYGFTNAVCAILVSVCIIIATGLPICIHAARAGVDIDLLTRGAGFGYIGSTITSLIYASFTFLFFAIESVILAMALELCLGIPQPIGYLLSALVVIPLVIFGISAISRFQVWTQPLFLGLNLLPMAGLLLHRPQLVAAWTRYAGEGGQNLSLPAFGAAVSVIIALVVQVGEQVDYLRFLPKPTSAKERRRWWLILLASGPGWVVGAIPKLLAGSLLAVSLLGAGVSPQIAAEPPRMYAFAFQSFLGPGHVSLALTLALVIICQMKINVTNAYAGSIAWSNFFSRLTHMHPGRVVWLIFNTLIALLVMELGIYRTLEQTLSVYSTVALAWIGALVSDLVINKPLGLSPPHIEFKRAHLYDVNPVGLGAMGLAILAAALARCGLAGPLIAAVSPFVALLVAILVAPLIAIATKGRYYLARTPQRPVHEAGAETCCICETAFESEDIAHCPAYDGPICSLCCTLDARCHDLCKPQGRFVEQAGVFLDRVVPKVARPLVPAHVAEYVAIFAILGVLIAGLLALVGIQLAIDHSLGRQVLVGALFKIFVALMIVTGIASWWLHLSRLGQRRAHGEMLRQTELLMDEIAAHERTDAALKKAKEAAEAANVAKSRYVVGLSHELRTPLNAIMGYAQLLEASAEIEDKPRRQIEVIRRNAGHLAALIDGLLDIAKIEAGKLDLARDDIAIRQVLSQIAEPFAVQAASKGIGFSLRLAPTLPAFVACDEKRLRQILINLLSNAVKFTSSGEVSLVLRYRNQVAEFLVSDTGPGIPASDQQRIFLPFERLHGSSVSGTGLGLTICQLLANVMGGDITLTSEIGVGSTFRLRLFLPPVAAARFTAPSHRASGYGRGYKVLVVDDDEAHRDLITATLVPEGFEVTVAATASEGLAAAKRLPPDLVLLDIELKTANGWALAEQLRQDGFAATRIVIISASAREAYRAAMASPFHDAFLMKPVDFERLHTTIANLFHQGETNRSAKPKVARTLGDLDRSAWPKPAVIDRLIELCEIGFVQELHETLRELAAHEPQTRDFVAILTYRLEAMDLRGLMRDLEYAGSVSS